MEVIATARYIRISPQKLGLVVAQIRKMPPQQAIAVLGFTGKKSAGPLKKVIASAIANAKNNFGLDENTLTFKSILVGIGPSSERYRPIARGRSHPILKRTTHIKVILEGETKKETKTHPDHDEKEVESTKDERLTTKAK